MCCTWFAENTERIKGTQKIAVTAPSHNFVGLYLRNKGVYRPLEKIVIIISISSYNMVNVGPLTAEIGSGVLGTPANCNRFRILASLLQ